MGIKHKQCGMTLVALGIQIKRVYCSKVLALISLPREYTIVVGIEYQRTVFSEFNQCVDLGTIAATKVIVAVNHVVIVSKTAAKQDGVQEDALFELSYVTQVRESVNNTRSDGCRRVWK